MTTDIPASQTVYSAFERLQSLNRRATAEEIKNYKDTGYVLFKDLIPKDLACVLRGEVEGIMAVIGLGHTKLKQTQQYLRGSALDALINGPLLHGLAEDLLGGPSRLYLPFTAVKSAGGGGRFHFHQDNNYTQFTDGLLGINLWTALVPMTAENGALQIAPGTHLGGTVESKNAGDGDAHRSVSVEPEDFEILEMEPGDTVAFSRLTIHGSGPNTTDENRVAYAVQYYRDDTRAIIDGEEVLLADNPRYTDISPLDHLSGQNAGSREGH
jgi:2-oxoglutarate-dependent dioxygenase